MAFTIKDAVTRLARPPVGVGAGETITEGQSPDLRAKWLARERRRRSERIDKETVMNIVRRIEALPVRDDRSADDILGYDERGLPS